MPSVLRKHPLRNGYAFGFADVYKAIAGVVVSEDEMIGGEFEIYIGEGEFSGKAIACH
jgi:hypothetical protein